MTGHYLDALRHLGYPLDHALIVGRSAAKARIMAERYGTDFCSLDAVEARAPLGSAIVAVTQDALPEVAEQALKAGAARVLLEKPGALSSGRLQALAQQFASRGAAGWVAFNRRFFPSVEIVRRSIKADGGAASCLFEITEIEERVLAERELKHLPDRVLERWGLANSVHVIDLAFHLVGFPARLAPLRSGRLPWHEAGAVFAGSGLSDSGALLTYVGNWSGAGRWRLEAVTTERRLVLCPLEMVTQQTKGSFDLVPIQVPAERDGVKPGVAPMIAEFLGLSATRLLPRLEETVHTLRFAESIFGYIGE